MKQQKLLAAILCAASTFTHAADDSEPLPILVVTGTRIEQPLQQSLSDTAVITRQQIEESQAVDVATVLKKLAGVEFYQSGGLGKQSSTLMRGTESDHVLVLLDGVRINSATTGTTALEHIMLDSIERIEVVRGNVSSLYGSEAIGGVIQLFTKRGKGEPSFNASAGFGSHGTKRLSAGFSGSTDSTSFSVNAGKVKTDGVSAIKPEMVAGIQPDDDGYDNTNFSTNARFAFGAEHSLSVSAFSSQGNNQYDTLRYDPVTFALISLPTDTNTNKALINKFSLTSENYLNEFWLSKLQLAQGTDDYQDYLDGTRTSFIKTTNRQVGWQNTLALSQTGSLLLGLESLDQQVSSTTLYTQDSRTINSAFAGYSGYFGAHQVQANVRQDRYSDFGAANTWSVGVGHALGEAWRASIGISTAFKAPNFNDMYGPAAWGSNPNLNPERSRNNEAGLHYSASGQSVDVVYFSNRTRDLIVYQWPTGMVNLDEAQSDGVEIGYSGEFGDTGITAAVTSQNPRDTATGEVLLRRAKSFGNLGVSQQLGALKLAGEWQYSGKREDIDINTFARTTLAAYSLVNLTVNYALGEQLDLAMRVDNLFDKDYMLAHGYNTLGRTVFVGLNYQP